ncbi:MAG: DUF5615 family PIN-like protein [Phycisphaerales bacterium]|nr:DUF5615 family PIN-like protein [Phycisphaerales bacterium]
MSLRLLMDANVDALVTAKLRTAGVDVLTAQEDGSDDIKDPELLDRAGELGRELFTHDRHFHAIGTRLLRKGIPFRGIFFAAHSRNPNRNRLYAEWLETRAKLENPEDVANQVIFIP